SCRPLESAVSGGQHPAYRVRQHACVAGFYMQEDTSPAAFEQAEMLRPLELPPVERQPAGIARLRASDDQEVIARQRVIGESDVSSPEGVRYCELEVGAAGRRRMRDDCRYAPGPGPRMTSR